MFPEAHPAIRETTIHPMMKSSLRNINSPFFVQSIVFVYGGSGSLDKNLRVLDVEPRSFIAAYNLTAANTKDSLVLGQPKTKNILGYGWPCPKASSLRSPHESGA